MSLPTPAGALPAVFEDALADAREGRIVSEWPFVPAVVEALTYVAIEPTDERIATARAAFAASQP